MKTRFGKQKTKTIIIAISLLVFLLAGALALAYTQKWWPFAEKNYIINGVNYGPPTEEETENSQNAKKEILKEEEANKDSSTDGLKQVNIGVSHADVHGNVVEVRAYVSGVVEGTGTCTATLTKSGAKTVTKSSEAFVDASTSQCESIEIPLSTFDQSGEWTLVVTYKSPTSQGESEKIAITI